MAPVGQRSQIMPGAYAPAAVGYDQDRPLVARILVARIRFWRDKSALIFRRGNACRFEKGLGAGQRGILLPGGR
jgi:hypothetical protein